MMISSPLIMHAGISPIVSQTSLTIILVALGLSLTGFIFGRLKGVEFLRAHRWLMTLSIILILVPVFFVMLPATFTFYTDSDVELASATSIITLIHGIIGLPFVVLGLTFTFNDLPNDTRNWMRRAFILLVITVAIGLVLFLQMLDLISFTGMHM